MSRIGELIAWCRHESVTLGTRILLVLVSVASASTILTVVLQDRSLARDLEQATWARLERARGTVSQLLADHLVGQSRRYRALASTPQFVANLESRHAPTLAHFAKELLAQHGAAAILILDVDGKELAGSGCERLRARTRADLRPGDLRPGDDPPGDVPPGVRPGDVRPGDVRPGDVRPGDVRPGDVRPGDVRPGDVRPGDGNTTPLGRRSATTLAHRGAPFSLVRVPLYARSKYLGSLIALESISSDLLKGWSRLGRAEVSIGARPAGDHDLALPIDGVAGAGLFVNTSLEVERRALENSRRNMLMGGLLGLAIALAASVFLARSLVSPIRAIQSGIARIGSGDRRHRFETTRGDEVGDVARGLNEMLDRLEESVADRIRAQDQADRLAYHDTLTGLANRRMLIEKLGSALERSGTSNVAVIFLDLDRFKDVNDALGHTAGDELLVEVAKRLDSCLQIIEDPGCEPHDIALLARLGGDEFTLLLSDVEDRGEVEVLAGNILESLAAPFELRGERISLSASLGIAMSPDDTADPETLLRDSDLAMFHAKNRGGKSYEFYSDTLLENATKRLSLDRRLQHAIEAEEFELHYQPKVDLRSGKLVGFEALIRWEDSELGTVGPGEFIAFAEETRAILPIGKWALREAVEQMLEWQSQGLTPVRVSVNVSTRQIEESEDFVGAIEDLLEETGLDPKLLDLEITESALLCGEESVIELLHKLRALGVGLSLDDFGTGYSSLSYLRRLPVDTLKIDRSFIGGSEKDAEKIAFVGSIVAMASVLSLKVVVEGVETEEQRRFLEELGCDEFQGFLFSRPLNAADATAMLREQEAARASRRKSARKRATGTAKKTVKRAAGKTRHSTSKKSTRKSGAKSAPTSTPTSAPTSTSKSRAKSASTSGPTSAGPVRAKSRSSDSRGAADRRPQ